MTGRNNISYSKQFYQIKAVITGKPVTVTERINGNVHILWESEPKVQTDWTRPQNSQKQNVKTKRTRTASVQPQITRGGSWGSFIYAEKNNGNSVNTGHFYFVKIRHFYFKFNHWQFYIYSFILFISFFEKLLFNVRG